MRIGWVEFDPESDLITHDLITQVCAMSYRDHEVTRTHVRRK